jgi:transposase-like protein
MTIGLIYHGKDKDIVVMGETLKDALRIYKKNEKEILHVLKLVANKGRNNIIEKPGKQKKTTADRLKDLKKVRFFSKPKTGAQIIEEFRSMDLHFKLADLTLPLRNLVRSGELRRTKDLPGGGKSKTWMWIAIK